MKRRLLTMMTSVCLMAGAGPDSPSAQEALYNRTIKPLLKARCYACHGALKQKAGLRLDSVTSILQGAKHSPIINLDHPHQSELIRRITSDDPEERMPPEGHPIKTEIIETIIQWIRAGAPAPSGEQPEAEPSAHWAFLHPKKQTPSNHPPTPINGNAIDSLLEQKHRDHGLSPTPLASPEIRLRRLFLDLIGRPPTPNDILQFQETPSQEAYEGIVDKLLASPEYGERWARHWMDIWRYSDWYGLGAQLRNSQKHLWRWRDWIIESLNQDKGYDQMIKEMLAGDEIQPGNYESLVATGFLARNYYLFNRTTWLDATLEHTSQAFLGLTLQCAKCHDHKYDPISQEDYYRFRAFFEPHQIRLDPIAGQLDLDQDGLPRAFDAHPTAPTYLHRRGNEKDPVKTAPLTPRVPALFAFDDGSIQSIPLPTTEHAPETRLHIQRDHLRRVASQLAKLEGERRSNESLTSENSATQLAIIKLQKATLEAEAQSIRDTFNANRSQFDPSISKSDQRALKHQANQSYARWQTSLSQQKILEAETALTGATDDKTKSELQTQIQDHHRQIEALKTESPQAPRLSASLKALESPAETDESRRAPYPSYSTGRRRALAQWIASADNPLTARVAVNHIWTRHFGEPLVTPVSDFGRRTKAPKLQGLLDDLAVRFTEHGWRMKTLHRLMVTSLAYQRDSKVSPPSNKRPEHDPDNHYYWRRNSIRMEAQVVRDAILAVTGNLDTTMSGPSIDPKTDSLSNRRSLYFKHSRDDKHSILSRFDDADIFRCYRRDESIVPQQALTLMNSQFAQEAALKLSQQLIRDGFEDNATFIDRAFPLILGVNPTKEEHTLCMSYLQAESGALEVGRSHLSPKARLIQALLNHNEFIMIR